MKIYSPSIEINVDLAKLLHTFAVFTTTSVFIRLNHILFIYACFPNSKIAGTNKTTESPRGYCDSSSRSRSFMWVNWSETLETLSSSIGSYIICPSTHPPTNQQPPSSHIFEMNIQLTLDGDPQRTPLRARCPSVSLCNWSRVDRTQEGLY